MKDFVTKARKIGLADFELSNITEQDFERFTACIKEVQALAEAYPNAYTRKQIAEEICKKIAPIETFLWIIQDRLKGLKTTFTFADKDEFVSDTDLAMKLILRLANINGEHYSLRTFGISDFVSQETKHGDREHFKAEGTVWVIASKGSIEPIKDKVYYGNELGKILTDLTERGCQLIVANTHYFASNCLPSHYSAGLEMFRISTHGRTSDVMCYLTDGALMDAVTKFRTWIFKNGGDISGLNEDKLFELIRNI